MDLAGQLLIAMPGMSDPRFARSVVFLTSYSGEGAMGLIVNKHASDLRLPGILERLDIPCEIALGGVPVHIGGPVETERGFVLHRDQSRQGPLPLEIPGGFVMTATQDILKDIAAGEGPEPFLFALGYAGWGAGQLEREIAQNGWLTAPAHTSLIFETPHGAIWDAALGSIGIDPRSLSGAAGRA